MSAKHTPGPWAWTEDGQRLRPLDGSQCAVQTIATTEGIMVLRGRAVDEMVKEVEANKRLIAAAPDLLEALKGLNAAVLKFTNASNEDWPELTCAQAVIEMAEGRA